MNVWELQKIRDFRIFLDDKRNKKLIIFGAGECGQTVFHCLEALGFACDYFVDNNPQKEGEIYCNRPIKGFPALLDENKDELMILIGVREQHYAIERQLLFAGFEQNRHFVFALEYLEVPYYDCIPAPLQETLFDDPYAGENLEDFFCPIPFTSIQLTSSYSICCGHYMKNVIFEELTAENFDHAWNSFDAQKVRQGVLDGSFLCCRKEECYYYLQGKLIKKTDVSDPYFKRIIDENLTKLPKTPAYMNIGIDDACNLRCKMCRSVFIGQRATKNSSALLAHMAKRSFPDTKCLFLCGSGDVFFSEIYREFIKQCIDKEHFPNLQYIYFYTNGNHFDRKAWEYVKPLAEKYSIAMGVSIDACKEETYQRIRIGGNFRKVNENLEMASDLRQSGWLKFFKFNFCVQRENFREIREFIDFGEKFGVDQITFQHLLSAPQNSDKVHLKSNIYYAEFREQFNDERFKRSNIDISAFRGYLDFGKESDEYFSVNPFELSLRNYN